MFQFPEWMVELLEAVEDRAENFTDDTWWEQNSADPDDVYEMASDALEIVYQLRKFHFIPER